MVVSNSVLIGVSLELQATDDGFSGIGLGKCCSLFLVFVVAVALCALDGRLVFVECPLWAVLCRMSGQDVLQGFNTFYAAIFSVEAGMRLVACGLYRYVWASQDWASWISILSGYSRCPPQDWVSKTCAKHF